MWQHRQNRLPIDLFGMGDADRDFDPHRVDRQADGVGDAQRVVPQRVAQAALV
jgi:hypothetical protein